MRGYAECELLLQFGGRQADPYEHQERHPLHWGGHGRPFVEFRKANSVQTLILCAPLRGAEMSHSVFAAPSAVKLFLRGDVRSCSKASTFSLNASGMRVGRIVSRDSVTSVV